MVALSAPVKALIDPVGGVPAAVEGRRWALPLAVLALCVSLSGAAGAVRWDPTSKVVSELTEAGDLARSSENDIQDKIRQAGRVRLVGGVAAGVVRPLSVLFAALALLVAGWLWGAKAPFGKYFAAASVAMLPVALYHLVFAVAAFHAPGLTEAEALTLLPSSLRALSPDASPELARVLGAVDFFSLWAAAMLGLGFAQATGLSRPRALVTGFALYGAYAAVFLIGLPGLTGGVR